MAYKSIKSNTQIVCVHGLFFFLQLHFNARYILFHVKTIKKNTEWFVISSRHKCFSLVCVFILPCDICEYNKLKAKDKEKRIIVSLLFIFQDWNTHTHTAHTRQTIKHAQRLPITSTSCSLKLIKHGSNTTIVIW